MAGDDGKSGYPSDQLIRNIRVGLHQTGYFNWGETFFPVCPRDFVVLLLAPIKGHSLVERYRDSPSLLEAIPHADRLRGLPRGPFVGQIDYNDIQIILKDQSRWMNYSERRVAEDLTNYLDFKRSNLPARTSWKAFMPMEPAREVAGEIPNRSLKILSLG